MVCVFQEEFVVPQYECDFKNRLKLGNLMRHVQQISTDHCDFLGIDDSRYKATNTAFLLAKTSVEIYEDIMAGDKITMVTRPSAPVRAVYYRYTSLYNEQGKEVAAVDARWILVDTNTRKILRHAPEALGLPFGDPPYKEQEMEIAKVNDAPVVGLERVTYSQTDVNRHLNNTVYGDIVCDYLPWELLEKYSVRKIVINYHREIMQGYEAEISLKRLEEAMSFYACGQAEGKKCFEAQITLG